MLRPAALALAGLVTLAPAAQAEIELSFYLGAQTAAHSGVEGEDPSPGGVGQYDFNVGWEGRSFEAPPYYGGRVMWFRDGVNGFGIEVNHQKVYADDETLDDNPGFETLEFTDGLNFATLNYARRLPARGSFTPYLGAGAGFAFPYVEVETPGSETAEYQITGPVVQAFAGARYDLTDRWGVFGEYKITWSSHDADLDGGGSLETEIVTNALSLGVGYRF